MAVEFAAISESKTCTVSDTSSVAASSLSVILKEADCDILNELTSGLKFSNEHTSTAKFKTTCKVCTNNVFYTTPEGFFEFCTECATRKAPLLSARYQLIEKLGKGSFSTTFLARDRYSNRKAKTVAIKVLNRNFLYIGVTEIQILQFLNQRDVNEVFPIVRLLDKFLWRDEFLCLVEEYLECSLDASTICTSFEDATNNGSYFDFEDYIVQKENLLERLQQFKKIVFQTMQFLMFTTQNEIIHADIKPENLLFVRKNSLKLKFIDFGNSLHLSNAQHYFDDFQIQPLCYRSPEVVFGLPFDCAIDAWSIGLLLLEIWLGRGIFTEFSDAKSLCKAIVEHFGPIPESFSVGKFWTEYAATVQEAAASLSSKPNSLISQLQTSGMETDGVDFFERLLRLDPKSRLTPKEAVCHPFLECFVESIVYCVS